MPALLAFTHRSDVRMSTVINRDIVIRQGAEFRDELQRYSPRYVFEATVAGTSGSSAPTFPTTVDGTVVDSTVTWVSKGLWSPELDSDKDVWLASTVYARRAKVVTPVVPVDLTGYTGAFQIRATLTATAALHTGTVTFGTLANGEFNMIITTVATAALSFDSAVYDLELSTSSGEVDFVLRGNVTMIKEVTR